MSRSKIVIVTGKFDTHADLVIVRLREMGHQPIRFHTADFPLSSAFTLRLDNRPASGGLRTSKCTIGLEDIGAVWWRRPKPPRLPVDFSQRESDFTRAEIAQALNGLWHNLDCYWMSFPAKIQAASCKLEQLRRATELGFEIPRTLVTTQPEEVMAFYEQCSRKMIFKVLGDKALGAYGGVSGKIGHGPHPDDVVMTYTTLVREEHLKNNLSQLQNTPCFFQEYVEKKVELRVTIIGDEIFVAEIDSQSHERTRVDWRHYDVPMVMRKGYLPPDVVQRCFALVRGYGLNFSAMDLILTPDGRYVFVENNPNGQWAFVEERVPEFKMIDTLANQLIEGRGRPSAPASVASERVTV
jgi:glutathione synthase/RimK-type ligase-like ATP-grasp enzyme